jgi:hypothetical protein
MAEVIQEAPREFWQPPSPLASSEASCQEIAPTMAEACPRCGTEFLLGSRFCHTCGGRRPEAMSAAAKVDAAVLAGLWQQAVARILALAKVIAGIGFPAWTRNLQFQRIKERLGLPTASMIAFFVGVGCLAGALLTGFQSAKTLVDWQAIQICRVEWLLGGTASFVAGILLKKPSSGSHE